MLAPAASERHPAFAAAVDHADAARVGFWERGDAVG